MLLDEMISPRLASRLWENSIDAVPLRDRGLLGKPDWEVWRYAQSEHRVFVTANTKDFVGFCYSVETHFGLLSIPGGCLMEEQYTCIASAMRFAAGHNAMSFGFSNCHVQVDVDLSVHCDILTKGSH